MFASFVLISIAKTSYFVLKAFTVALRLSACAFPALVPRLSISRTFFSVSSILSTSFVSLKDRRQEVTAIAVTAVEVNQMIVNIIELFQEIQAIMSQFVIFIWWIGE